MSTLGLAPVSFNFYLFVDVEGLKNGTQMVHRVPIHSIIIMLFAPVLQLFVELCSLLSLLSTSVVMI